MDLMIRCGLNQHTIGTTRKYISLHFVIGKDVMQADESQSINSH